MGGIDGLSRKCCIEKVVCRAPLPSGTGQLARTAPARECRWLASWSPRFLEATAKSIAV